MITRGFITPSVLLLGFFLGPCQTFGQSQCEDHLTSRKISYTEKVDKLLGETEAEFLKAHLRQFVTERWMSGNGKLSQEAVEEAFQEYLRLRLRNFDPLIQAHIYSMAYYQIKVIEADGFEVGGRVNPESHRIEVVLPKSLMGTVIDYYVRVHEVEHVIQGLMVGLKAATSFDPRFANYRFHLEKGAMRAEGAFLMAFPSQFLKEYLKAVTEYPTSEETEIKAFMEGVLKNSIEAESISDYLKRNWDSGRYSRSKLIRKNIVSCAIFPGSLPFIMLLNYFIGG